MKRSTMPSLRRMMFEEAEEVSPAERPDNEESVDRQILRAIMDAERNAVKAGRSQESMNPMESLRRKSLRFLLEAEGDGDEKDDEKNTPPLDIGTFAMEIMRVVKNFDTLLDIPTVILNKAKTYIAQKYDEKTSKSFIDLLENEYDITLGKDGLKPEIDSDPESHIAVGARSETGGV